jgi:hypothetical protein
MVPHAPAADYKPADKSDLYGKATGREPDIAEMDTKLVVTLPRPGS